MCIRDSDRACLQHRQGCGAGNSNAIDGIYHNLMHRQIECKSRVAQKGIMEMVQDVYKRQAVGRFPVTYAEEAQVLVDKTISYAQNANVGAWQNTLMFMGDDGNGNLHMQMCIRDRYIAELKSLVSKSVRFH